MDANKPPTGVCVGVCVRARMCAWRQRATLEHGERITREDVAGLSSQGLGQRLPVHFLFPPALGGAPLPRRTRSTLVRRFIILQRWREALNRLASPLLRPVGSNRTCTPPLLPPPLSRRPEIRARWG
jgi:hypothetical protein